MGILCWIIQKVPKTYWLEPFWVFSSFCGQLFFIFLSVVWVNCMNCQDKDPCKKIMYNTMEFCVHSHLSVRVGLKHILHLHRRWLSCLTLCFWELGADVLYEIILYQLPMYAQSIYDSIISCVYVWVCRLSLLMTYHMVAHLGLFTHLMGDNTLQAGACWCTASI